MTSTTTQWLNDLFVTDLYADGECLRVADCRCGLCDSSAAPFWAVLPNIRLCRRCAEIAADGIMSLELDVITKAEALSNGMTDDQLKKVAHACTAVLRMILALLAHRIMLCSLAECITPGAHHH